MANNTAKLKRTIKNHTEDFYMALENRNFDDMADIYNEMFRYSPNDGSERAENTYFSELGENNIIELPLTPKSLLKKMDDNFYYFLKDNSIQYVANEYEDDDKEIFFNDYSKECIEAKKIKKPSVIKVSSVAKKHLDLKIGDIVEITLLGDSIIIEKLKRPYGFEM